MNGKGAAWSLYLVLRMYSRGDGDGLAGGDGFVRGLADHPRLVEGQARAHVHRGLDRLHHLDRQEQDAGPVVT